MSLAELEAVVGWLERNRVREHLDLLKGDHRYDWVAQARRATARRRGRETLNVLGSRSTRTWGG